MSAFNLASQIGGTAPTDAAHAPVGLRCDEAWLLHGQKCYRFSNMKTSWDMSRQLCGEMGGDLVKIETRTEQQFLFEKIKEINKSTEEMFWMGLSDAETEGDWRWTDGSSLNQSLAFWFVYGSANEPDNWISPPHPQGEDCAWMGVRVWATEFLSWFDVPCTITSRFMCEKQPRRSADFQQKRELT
ncbi:C-type lectin domain family 4 member E-like [Boleophthalmus pectinirostris]|uniref:C-type lectin domain family 4 member E-like n=1 Tax=Boleophthalmus pectinirostris TaxID=150288 RepID=UPI00242E9D1A|nr:C-type lectin domain family 4 member E-like [Boleophthalmus pectinirostris]